MPVSPDSRPLLVGRARGLAAGTLLACGSVLVAAVHAADSAGPQHIAEPGVAALGPGLGSGAQEATVTAVTPRTTPPAATSAQSFTGPPLRSQAVRRNAPIAVTVPGAPVAYADLPSAEPGQPARSGPIERAVTRHAPVPGATAGAVGAAVAPADQALTPVAPLTDQDVSPARDATVQEPTAQAPVLGGVLAPLEAATQPAVTMLPPLPLLHS